MVKVRVSYPTGHQVELIGADVLQAEIRGRAAKMLGKVGDSSEIGALGMRRQVPNPHVLTLMFFMWLIPK